MWTRRYGLVDWLDIVGDIHFAGFQCDGTVGAFNNVTEGQRFRWTACHRSSHRMHGQVDAITGSPVGELVRACAHMGF